jgi:uncharacterized protein (TIGR01777 family)
MNHYQTATILNFPLEQVFAWFERPGAFERLNPPWQKVKVIEKRGTIHDGDYLLISVALIPTTFQIDHFDFIPNKQFCDRQVKGLYKHWEHCHLFAALNKDQTQLEDVIEYAFPRHGFYKYLFTGKMETMLKQLFRYRQEVLEHDLKIHQKYRSKALKILIAGSSGTIGSQLAAFLTTGGHSVTRLMRTGSAKEGHFVEWDPDLRHLDPNQIEGHDVIINLAGAGVAEKRWSESRKKAILESRVKATHLLAEAINQLKNPPKVFINASAIGYYGNTGDKQVTEQSNKGDGFLAEVCQKWEEAANEMKTKHTRQVLLRFGIVLTPAGGALQQMLAPFKWGVGGAIGSGKQYMSWIALDDVLGAIHEAIFNEKLTGPVNVVSPNAVTNAEFAKTLAKVLKRPALLKMPAFVARAAFGEMADEMLLSSSRVIPEKLLNQKFDFAYSDLEKALRHLLGR